MNFLITTLVAILAGLISSLTNGSVLEHWQALVVLLSIITIFHIGKAVGRGEPVDGIARQQKNQPKIWQ